MGDDDAIHYTEKVYFLINTIIKKTSVRVSMVLNVTHTDFLEKTLKRTQASSSFIFIEHVLHGYSY